MQARNNVKRAFHLNAAARLVPAAARQQLAARLDGLVARWLERCAANAEAGQRVFRLIADRKAMDGTFQVGAAANPAAQT